MGTIQTAQAMAGFTARGSAPRVCGFCQHASNLEGLRCQLGGWWTSKQASCSKFADRLPMAPRADAHALPAPDTRIHIGPTDV